MKMQFKNILIASCLALGASATATNATDIAPSVQNRFAQIDLGYQLPADLPAPEPPG